MTTLKGICFDSNLTSHSISNLTFSVEEMLQNLLYKNVFVLFPTLLGILSEPGRSRRWTACS